MLSSFQVFSSPSAGNTSFHFLNSCLLARLHLHLPQSIILFFQRATWNPRYASGMFSEPWVYAPPHSTYQVTMSLFDSLTESLLNYKLQEAKKSAFLSEHCTFTPCVWNECKPYSNKSLQSKRIDWLPPLC